MQHLASVEAAAQGHIAMQPTLSLDTRPPVGVLHQERALLTHHTAAVPVPMELDKSTAVLTYRCNEVLLTWQSQHASAHHTLQHSSKQQQVLQSNSYPSQA
jgi:ABC-type sulfate/molybdate transport systems ATPase subunit